MDGFLAGLQFWHWLILAAVLAAIEAMLPGMFFIWFGLAAGLVGLVTLAVPTLSWEWETALFVVFMSYATLGAVFGIWRLRIRRPRLSKPYTEVPGEDLHEVLEEHENV